MPRCAWVFNALICFIPWTWLSPWMIHFRILFVGCCSSRSCVGRRCGRCRCSDHLVRVSCIVDPVLNTTRARCKFTHWRSGTPKISRCQQDGGEIAGAQSWADDGRHGTIRWGLMRTCWGSHRSPALELTDFPTCEWQSQHPISFISFLHGRLGFATCGRLGPVAVVCIASACSYRNQKILTKKRQLHPYKTRQYTVTDSYVS